MDLKTKIAKQAYLQNMYLLDTVWGDIIRKSKDNNTNDIIIDIEIKLTDELITYVVNSYLWDIKTKITQRKINGEYKTISIEKSE